MTATDSILLDNLSVRTESLKLKDAGFITAAQYAVIKDQLPVPKTHQNLLVRIGFFVLGSMLFSSIVGAISLFTLSLMESGYQVILFIYALIGIFFSELLARNQYHAHGLDDAFILGFQGLLFVAFGVAFQTSMAVFLSMAVFGLLACLRYVNTISAIFCLVGITGMVGSLVIDFGIVNKMFLPFIMLFVAAIMYALYHGLKDNPKTFLYQNSLTVVQVFSLILGYASVNYLVVRELSQSLMGLVVEPNNDIALAWLFYMLTFVVPVSFMVYALLKKDKVMLIIGILTFGFSIFTIRYYYSLMPIESALVLGGIILFALAYYFIRSLKHKETGITFKPDRYTDTKALAYAQAVIVNSHPGLKTHHAPTSPMPFGGGDFSGGGAGETY